MNVSSLLAEPMAEPRVQHKTRAESLVGSSHLDRGRLDAVNRVIRESVKTWTVTDRVRRLALPALLYNEADLPHMRFLLLDDAEGEAVAAAVWEDIGNKAATRRSRRVQLHGLYVLPNWQGRGLGSSLLEFVGLWTGIHGFEGTVARAWREADSFFRLRGFQPVSDLQETGDVSQLLWRPAQWLC